MPAEFLALAPVPPFLAAVFIGVGILFGPIRGEASERFSSRCVFYSVLASSGLILAAAVARHQGRLDDSLVLGSWLRSGSYQVDIGFTLDGLSLTLAGLICFLSLVVTRFSIHYMHRETGFHRFFLALALFVSAMLLLTTAGNAVLAFAGWELAGVTSYLLIAFHYDRPTATGNATRAFVTNRIGDAGFVLGIVLAFLWTGGIGWGRFAGPAAGLEEWQAGILACCFLLAAAAKSAQVPLAPWLARAMEGPTPSSAIFYGAVMIHAGVYLVLRLQPLFEQAPLAMELMAAVGAATALYGYLCGLAQTDVKSALIFSASGQVGLMFFAAGLGFWRLALCHLCAHALFRGYQFLAAPSLMHGVAGMPARPVHAILGKNRLLYVAALQRFWLDSLGNWVVARPAFKLGADLQSFESQLLEPLFGLPARSEDPLAPMERDGKPGVSGMAGGGAEVFRVSGVPGRAIRGLANASHWFEEKLVLQGAGQNILVLGRRLGNRLNHVEELLNQPRYLVVVVLATLLAVF